MSGIFLLFFTMAMASSCVPESSGNSQVSQKVSLKSQLNRLQSWLLYDEAATQKLPVLVVYADSKTLARFERRKQNYLLPELYSRFYQTFRFLTVSVEEFEKTYPGLSSPTRNSACIDYYAFSGDAILLHQKRFCAELPDKLPAEFSNKFPNEQFIKQVAQALQSYQQKATWSNHETLVWANTALNSLRPDLTQKWLQNLQNHLLNKEEQKALAALKERLL